MARGPIFSQYYGITELKFESHVGFRLSATVEDKRCSSSRSNDSGKYYVTVHFDRGKITSAHCSCELSTNWCAHVVATCLARLKEKNTVTVHMPVSDSLNLLDREQLLKFAQYLLCEHQNERTVETAQNLLDRLLSRKQSEQPDNINAIAGAPDPTAGPGKEWLDEIYSIRMFVSVPLCNIATQCWCFDRQFARSNLQIQITNCTRTSQVDFSMPCSFSQDFSGRDCSGENCSLSELHCNINCCSNRRDS